MVDPIGFFARWAQLDWRTPIPLDQRDLVRASEFAYTLSDGRITALCLAGWEGPLPRLIAELEDLEVLRICYSPRVSISLKLSELPKLRSLYLPHNDLGTIPAEVLECKSLQLLGINGNRIRDVPPEICDLQALKVLKLGTNPIAELPVTLPNARSLESLFVDWTKIREVPGWLSRMRTLRRVSVAGCELTSFPRALLDLTDLAQLDISNLPIEALPQALFELRGLEELRLSQTHCAVLPADVRHLQQLNLLDLSDTRLRELPAELASLPRMERLAARGLETDRFPDVVCELPELRNLALAGTRASEVPASIRSLVRLTDADLSGMGLVSVPPELFLLPSIQRINLSGNRIRRLPASIIDSGLGIHWKRGRSSAGVLLQRNPLESPPPEILSRGSQAVRTYFATLANDAKPLEEAKLILIGDGGAGKTSLVRRMLGRAFRETEPQTHGINIEAWPLEHRGRRVTARVWDFGGQEIMHATHQFFLSKRSLYVVVLDGRRDDKVEYWLKHVEAFGGDSPILVAINKTDENPGFDVNRKFLEEKFPRIAGFFRISCKTNDGLDSFLHAVARHLNRLDHTRMLWSAAWFAVKHDLENTAADFIPHERFEFLCHKQGIDAPEVRSTLLDLLHDLGVVLHFTDLPLRETNVINPSWVTEGVYRLLNAPEVARSAGVLPVRSIGDILDATRYPRSKHHFIVELMRKFELCYPIDDSAILLPSLLPVAEPSYAVAQDAARFTLDYDFLPRSVMPRFIVRMHRDIVTGQAWRTGVVLRSDVCDGRAIVRADEEERKISIAVEGAQRRDYLSVVLHAFRDINASFTKLTVVERVPMPDAAGISVSYRHLLRLERMGETTYIPDGAEKAYVVADVLGSIHIRRPAEEEILTILRSFQTPADTRESLGEKANRILMLEPNIFGLGVNINNLIDHLMPGRQASEK